jgi:hypothetical protein
VVVKIVADRALERLALSESCTNGLGVTVTVIVSECDTVPLLAVIVTV